MAKEKEESKDFRLRLFLASIVSRARVFCLGLKGYDVQYTTIIEGTVRLDKLNPKGGSTWERTRW